MGFLPGDIHRYLMSGFTPSTTKFIHNNIISEEVCRVFVLRCQFASHLTCLVSFHQISSIIYNQYSHMSYIHTSIHQYFHICIHNICTISIHTWLHQTPKVLFDSIPSVQSSFHHYDKRQVLTNEQLASVIFIKSFIPSVFGQEVSPIKWLVLNNGQLESTFILFQATSPKQRTV